MSAPPPTAEQRAAIEARDRDVFCEAGAGTGKTRVLVERYCEAVEREEAGVEEILAFTFTERAAAELRTRIRLELGRRAAAARERGEAALAARLSRAARETERAWVTTIHGFCRRLLAAHPAAVGIDPRFRVLDESEAARLRRRAGELAVEDVARADPEAIAAIAAYRGWRIAAMAEAAHERLRSQGLSEPRLPPAADPVRSIRDPEKDEPALSPAEREAALAAWSALDGVLAAFCARYEELKAERSGLDFGDLELRALELLRSSPAATAAWRGRFRHLMVDEFQDTNRVQLDLVEELRGPETRVFRVGDELQSIYRFRNADLAVFRAERERAAADRGTATLPLTGNFRARPELVAAVNELGRALLGDGFRPLAAARPSPEPGGSPAVELLLTLDEGKANGWEEHAEALEPPPSERQAKIVAEARTLALRLRELVEAGEAEAGEIVVLLRAFTHVDAYEEALDRAGLDPYVVGGRGYWSQQQVEDLLRLCEAIANPLDDEMLLGALACPAGGVGPDALWLLRRATVVAVNGGEPRPRGHIWPVVEWRFGDSERRPEPLAERWLEAIPEPDAERLRRFCARLAELRAAAPVLALDELVERAMLSFDYDLALLARERGRGRMANVRKLMRLAREYEAHEGRDLRGLLTAARELAERDEREGLAATQAEDHDGVRVMTVHAAKGLEFPVVAVPDLARGLSQGERGGDVVIGRLGPGSGAPARFGLRLALPAARSFGVWELHELEGENVREAAEEGARLVHVAATRAQERLILSGAFRPSDAEPATGGPRESAIRRLLPALAERGWTPERVEVELELEPPAPCEGAEAIPLAARLAARISAPSQERARRLAERRPPLARAERAAEEGDPPLARPRPAVPVGHLSYSALAAYERCGYRFYVERVLGVEEPAGRGRRDPEDPDARPAPSAGELRLGFGNAVHAALERSAAAGWATPGDEELRALLLGEGIEDDAELERARAMVEGWLGSGLLAELRAADARAEIPFAVSLAGSIVRGQIDLLAAGPVPTVVDYKTDALGDEGPGALAGRYAAQRELYALALAGGEAEPVRAIHVFLEAPEEPVEESFDAARLAAARARLEELIRRIRAGGFAPTADPSPAVCLGCPAAARLCPHPGWRPGR